MVSLELVRLLGQYGKTVKINEEVPPDQINDWDELVKRRNYTSDPVYRQQVRARMTEVLHNILPNIRSFFQLVVMWNNVPVGSDDREQIEARMREVVNITDEDELNRLRDEKWIYICTFEEMVRQRRRQLISEVSAKKCPNWFLAFLSDPDSCGVREVLDQKVAELKKELTITD